MTIETTGTAVSLRAPLPGVDLSGHRLGSPQRTGLLTVVPVFGPSYPGVTAPRDGIKLQQVTGYGKVVLTHPAGAGPGIVPLHMGYIQDGAQNHALCRSALLAPGESRTFDDACCVQAAQGGYLAGRDQWFFVLPLELRARALAVRGVQSYSKLWSDIADLCSRYGLPARGHLEQLISRRRAVLTQYRSRLELAAGQLGALFLLGRRLVGIEIAPDPQYFAQVWPALVCFCYGPSEWHASRVEEAAVPFPADSPARLRAALAARRRAVTDEVAAGIEAAGWSATEAVEGERLLDLRLLTVGGEAFAGQLVLAGDRLVYASLTARESG